MVAHAHCGGTKQNDATNNGVTTQHGQCGGGQTRNNCLLLLIACTLYCHVLLDHSCKHHRFFISDYSTPGVLQCERVPFPARPHFCVTCLPLHTFVRCRPCVLRATCLKTVQQHHTTSHQFSDHFSASRVITQSTAVQMGTNSSRHDILTNILNFSYHPFHHTNPSHNLQRCQWAPTPAAVLPQPYANTPD